MYFTVRNISAKNKEILGTTLFINYYFIFEKRHLINETIVFNCSRIFNNPVARELRGMSQCSLLRRLIIQRWSRDKYPTNKLNSAVPVFGKRSAAPRKIENFAFALSFRSPDLFLWFLSWQGARIFWIPGAFFSHIHPINPRRAGNGAMLNRFKLLRITSSGGSNDLLSSTLSHPPPTLRVPFTCVLSTLKATSILVIIPGLRGEPVDLRRPLAPATEEQNVTSTEEESAIFISRH